MIIAINYDLLVYLLSPLVTLRPSSDAALYMSRIECKWGRTKDFAHLHSIRLMWSTASELGLTFVKFRVQFALTSPYSPMFSQIVYVFMRLIHLKISTFLSLKIMVFTQLYVRKETSQLQFLSLSLLCKHAYTCSKAGYTWKVCKRWKFCFCRNLNLKVLNIYIFWDTFLLL